MSSDDSGDDHPLTEQLQTWEQLLDRFSSEVHCLSRTHVSSHRRLEANLKGQLAVMKRDLSRQLTREVEDLRASLSLASRQPQFPLFRKLPVELRVKIWEFALFSVPRVLEIRTSFLSRGSQKVMPRGIYHGIYATPCPTSSYSTLGFGSLPPDSDGSNFAHDFRPGGPPRPLPGPPPALNWMPASQTHNLNGGQTSNPLPGSVMTTNRLPCPALVSVCHESRTVALRHGSIFKTKVIEDSLSPPPMPTPPPPTGVPPYLQASQTYSTAYTWFSPSIDYLKLPSTGPAFNASVAPPAAGTGELPPPLNIQGWSEQVLIRKPEDKMELERQVKRFQSSEIFTRLKTVGIIVTHDIVRPKSGGWEWGLGPSPSAQLFPTGEGPIRFVDLQCPSSASKITSLFPQHTPPNEVWRVHHRSLLIKDPSRSPLLNNDVFRPEGWDVSWLVQRYSKFPLTFNLGEIVDVEELAFRDGEVMTTIREENGWVKEELKRMPEVRLLHAFVLDEFNDVEAGGGGYQGEKGVEMRRLYGGSGGGEGFGGRLRTFGSA